ncbi:MAG: AAA family ATPase [Huintestinicola sp.]|uniref:AAA family ATPase n=1 Tax=Huintestinicola sp. TaxID=2981661 RepID=UPI003F0FC426
MTERPADKNAVISALIENVEKIIVGKKQSIELVIAAMLTGGHVLIEDVPGVGKTRLVSSVARSCGGTFGRIQMTPDVMPSDITGFTMINTATGANEFRKGAAFCNFLLADEINRASPKSQSALLEIMEEGQVSLDGEIYPLPKPFMVLATQNPVETYGTYHLPEAQMDRFVMKISMGYPDRTDELSILERNESSLTPKTLEPVITCEDILSLMDKVKLVRCSENIKKYIIELVNATRTAEYIKLGVSPRGSIALYNTAKAMAMISGRGYVIPDDVKLLAPYVLAHRIILTPKGRSVCATPEGAVAKLLTEVPVPVE